MKAADGVTTRALFRTHACTPTYLEEENHTFNHFIIASVSVSRKLCSESLLFETKFEKLNFTRMKDRKKPTAKPSHFAFSLRLHELFFRLFGCRRGLDLMSRYSLSEKEKGLNDAGNCGVWDPV